MRLLATLCLVLSLSACRGLDIVEATATSTNAVIFPADFAAAQQAAIYTDVIDVSGYRYWTPTPQQVQAMRVAVLQHLIATGEREILAKYGRYQSQFFGFIWNDERYIYGNYFCDAFGLDWRANFIIVMDGGNCYFQATYLPGSAALSRITINGEA